MINKYKDPVNYKLKEKDLKLGEEFNSFLKELTDVPSSIPLNGISIDEAGITNQHVIVMIQDIEGRDFSVAVYCDITMKVELKGHRGIHMSRCEEILFDACSTAYKSLDDFAIVLAKNLKDKQESDISQVRIIGTYLHKRLTRVTKKESQDKLYLISNVTLRGEKLEVQTGIKAYNMTACPCTRTFTKYSVIPKLIELGLNKDLIQQILDITHSGTHTQRGTISLMIDNHENQISHRQLYSVLDNSCHLIYELLKRPDEHDLVVRALNKPQFTEDVVREVAHDAVNMFVDCPKNTRLRVESILLDSIHIHDVCTLIDKSFLEIRNELDQ